jgi:hypothetical protein
MQLRFYNKHCPVDFILFNMYRTQFLSINDGGNLSYSDRTKTPSLITKCKFALPYPEHINLITFYNFKLIFFGMFGVHVVQSKEV